jgi:hypothetical protein
MEICNLGGTCPELPDAGEGACCYGAINGPQACTCWRPVHDTEQAPLACGDLGLRDRMCQDCAYRPRSPERCGEPGYQGTGGELDEFILTGELFICHQGMRRVAKWVHPSGAEVPAHPGDYQPPFDAMGRPYKADGTPGDLCAGWAARRLKYLGRGAS